MAETSRRWNRQILTGKPPIDARHPFGQAEHVVDDGITDIAVEVAQFVLGFAVDGHTERGNAGALCFIEGLADVLSGISRVTIIVIVRTSVSEDDKKLSAGL